MLSPRQQEMLKALSEFALLKELINVTLDILIEYFSEENPTIANSLQNDPIKTTVAGLRDNDSPIAEIYAAALEKLMIENLGNEFTIEQFKSILDTTVVKNLTNETQNLSLRQNSFFSDRDPEDIGREVLQELNNQTSSLEKK